MSTTRKQRVNNMRRRTNTRDLARGQRAVMRPIRTRDTRKQRVVMHAKQHVRPSTPSRAEQHARHTRNT
jgi:hypothetical protein